MTEPYNQYDPPNLPSRTIHFWFRTRRITGVGFPPDRVHSHVVRLRIQPSRLDRFVIGFLSLFPTRVVHSYLERWLPEWFLPPAIVVKSEKPDWEDEFDDEVALYNRLSSLQGTVIPYYYGTTRLGGVRTHILSDIGGVSLPLKGASGIDDPTFRKMLLRALGAIALQGFVHDDLKLDNFHLVGDKIMVLDLEQVEFVESLDRRKFFCSLLSIA
ncbi:hypothetical protein PT974_00761 [Cladobotryum mycophilum]|uniref:Protein kinase domain-containing protein n=1 Tax=Cladobotryum mycophilum TaxID=491253 RepID=A0ABR0T1U0_9HYPO